MSPTNDRDAGFCSGGSENEEDLDLHHQMRLISNTSSCSESRQSPSDAASEDSSLGLTERFLLPPAPASSSFCAPKNKRKSSEPIRVLPEPTQSGPLKKRLKLENEKLLREAEEQKLKQSPLLSPDPFRPWASLIEPAALSPAHAFKRHPGVTTLHRVPFAAESAPQFLSPEQDEPIPLLAKKAPQVDGQKAIRNMLLKQQQQQQQIQQQQQQISLVPERLLLDEQHLDRAPSEVSAKAQSEGGCSSQTSRKEAPQSQGQQRNYKNMTRERRIEANARERTRVHTISAAFEKLRHSVPAYSNTQKLSKLSVLRIACAYIMSLSRVAGLDYSEDQSEPQIGDCVEALTRVIQTEGKLRKKKDE